MKKNHLGLTEEQLLRAIANLGNTDPPDKIPMGHELQVLIGQFEALIESLGNELTVFRGDGTTVTFTRIAATSSPNGSADRKDGDGLL